MKTIIDFPNDYCVLDFETTGLSAQYDAVIEVAVLRVRSNEIVDKFTTLCVTNIPLDNFIVQKTGITNEMISSKPDFKSILPILLDFIGSDTVIGYNINFDIGFINKYAVYNNPTIDCMRFARKLLPELPHHRLCDIAENYGISATNLHRSVADCEVTKLCYDKLRLSALEKYGTEEEFKRICTYRQTSSHSKLLRHDEITTDITEFDETHPLFNKVCVFTGKLDRMQRKEAMQRVVDLGGLVADGVTAKTNFLILGNNDYCKSIKDGKSSKHKKAELYALKGMEIEIIPEDVFYQMLEM